MVVAGVTTWWRLVLQQGGSLVGERGGHLAGVWSVGPVARILSVPGGCQSWHTRTHAHTLPPGGWPASGSSMLDCPSPVIHRRSTHTPPHTTLAPSGAATLPPAQHSLLLARPRPCPHALACTQLGGGCVDTPTLPLPPTLHAVRSTVVPCSHTLMIDAVVLFVHLLQIMAHEDVDFPEAGWNIESDSDLY